METIIEKFVKTGSGSGDGSGSGYGDGYGSGSGDGSGSGYGDGDGYGSGSGYGYGDSYGDGDGYGSGYGSGSGYGYGDGDGDGSGSGSGYGYGDSYGDGDGYGSGDGSGDGLLSINGEHVYKIDNIPTIIENVKKNIAKGYILQSDLSLTPCFIVKDNNQFAHGETLHEAFSALQGKLYDDSSEEERIEKFNEHFADYTKKYSAKELFVWHHILTGSCKQGRESFAKDNGIDIDKDSFTIYEFIKLTENSYGGDIIKKLKNERI